MAMALIGCIFYFLFFLLSFKFTQAINNCCKDLLTKKEKYIDTKSLSLNKDTKTTWRLYLMALSASPDNNTFSVL